MAMGGVRMGVLGLALAGAPGEARVTVAVVPGISFIRQGSTVELKARTTGASGDSGWTWTLVEGGGVLSPGDFGRIRYTADPAEPWARARIRATSIRHPEAWGEATLEILPADTFRVLEMVLGQNWIKEAAGHPVPIRLSIQEPSWFSFSEVYTLTAEIDGPERDRFTWSFRGPVRDLTLKEPEPGRETVIYRPPLVRNTPSLVRIRIQSLDDPKQSLETQILLPQNDRPAGGREHYNFK